MESQTYTQILAKASNNSIRRRRPLISLTPLVDVVFILLVFFMLASSFSDQRAIGLMTPAIGESASTSKTVLLRVQRDGGLDLNGEPLTVNQLQARAAQFIQTVGERQFLVQPDKGVELQWVVVVLDALYATGVQDISLIRK
jgi:biopolymer transport protein ExbD